MSDIVKGIRTYLQTVSDVTDLISTRMYPQVLKKNATMPACTISLIDSNSHHHLTGGIGQANARVQIDCYSTTQTEVNDLAEKIRAGLHMYHGAAGDETIQHCSLELKRDSFDQPTEGSDVIRYRKILDFEVVHNEATTAF